ncbi:MAG: ATP-binding protein [Rhodanobacter sp.]
MSNVNIKRAVENIKTGTTVYTPIVELVVNAIQAVEEGKHEAGLVKVTIKRSPQMEMDDEGGSIPAVDSIFVEDNGVGFNEVNREAFDTLYTDNKISQGGKGFGRFTCLKYFDSVKIDSTFLNGGSLKRRQFEMGKDTEIIVNEEISEAAQDATGTKVCLGSVKHADRLNKKLPTIANGIVEKLLPYFIAEDYACPRVTLVEEDGSAEIVLNDYLSEKTAVIKEVSVQENSFRIDVNARTHTFQVRIFKFFSPRNTKSKISLVAHNREVTETPTQLYIPEFAEDFYEKRSDGSSDEGRNYVIKTYVFGDYLNDHVSLERGGFEFQKENDALYGISQSQIERAAAELTRAAIASEVTSRQEKKAAQITSYVETEAPWHKNILKKMDLNSFPYNPSSEQIEVRLQEEKFKDEAKIRREVSKILNDGSIENFEKNITDIVERISETSKNDLVHYVALRKNVLDLFEKSLQITASDDYEDEGIVHDIIFPRKKDSEALEYKRRPPGFE